MMRLWMLSALLAVPLQATAQPPEIDQAFEQLYNFNFPAAHDVLNRYIVAHPQEPLPYAVRGAAYLFFELDRLGILEGEFFVDDKRIADKRQLKPDEQIRARFQQAVNDAQSRATRVLAANSNDHNALFAMCMTQGLTFFIRWFVRFDDVQGSKDRGISNLQLVAQHGHYLKPFAKILLAIAYMRDKKPRQTEQLLAGLTREYPSNPLLRRELAKVESTLADQ